MCGKVSIMVIDWEENPQTRLHLNLLAFLILILAL